MEALSLQYNFQNKWSTLILLYNPCKNIEEKEFEHYFDLIDNVGLICGDLNAHHNSWETNSRDNFSGKSLFSNLNQFNNLSLLNPVNFETRTDPHSGKTSNIDHIIATSQYQHKALSIGANLGSDHSTIIMEDQSSKKPHLYFRPRWAFKEGNWANWKELIKTKESDQKENPLEDYYELTEKILTTSKNFFHLQDNSTPRRPGQPWWTKECAQIIKERKQALKIFKKFPTPCNRRNYNKKCKEAKNIIYEAKKTAWRAFLSELGPQTPVGKVWKFFRAMEGTIPSSAIPFSNHKDEPLNNSDCAEMLARHYKGKFSNSIILDNDQNHCIQEACRNSTIDSYNLPFSAHEMEAAIKSLKNKSSIGNDYIHNKFLTHLPATQRAVLLNILNKFYSTNCIPPEWKVADIIPILKPGKNPVDPAAYRPISLLSVIGKLMERMVSCRLRWFLESKNVLSSQQFGFRNQRSTLDPLAILEHEIQTGFRNQQITLVVTLDLSAAFDRADINAIIYKLASQGLKGNIIRWLGNYMRGRSYRVWVQNKSSALHKIISSVPQGSPLAPILFNVLLCDPPITKASILIYADDITLYTTAKTMTEAISIMQESLNTIANWCTTWGQEINPQKSAMTYFTRKRVEPEKLKLQNVDIPFQKTIKILGITFDAPYLTWKTHIENTAIKCQKRLNLMRSLAGKSGISMDLLKLYYNSHIRSLINYGLPLYSSAAPSNLNKINVIHNHAARLITGAWRSTPLHALYVEANILPPDLQLEQVCAIFLAKLKSAPADHPILKLFQRDRLLFELVPYSGKSYKSPLDYRVKYNYNLKETIQKLSLLSPANKPIFPPWIDLSSIFSSSPLEPGINKDSPNPATIFNKVLEEKFPCSTLAFTDGSLQKDPATNVGAGMYIPSNNRHYKWKLSPHHSIVSAELFAIHKASNLLKNENSVAIFTDSQAALSLLKSNNPKSYKAIINSIHNNLSLPSHSNTTIHWIPGHCNIKGNEEADKNAKSAAKSTLPLSPHPTDFLELKYIIKNETRSNWEKRWNLVRGNLHLGTILHKIPAQAKSQHSSRDMEVIFSQCRLGKCNLNYPLFRIKRVDSPLCDYCMTNETTHHFFINCNKFLQERATLKRNLEKKKINSFNLETLLSNPTIISEVENYIRATGRLI